MNPYKNDLTGFSKCLMIFLAIFITSNFHVFAYEAIPQQRLDPDELTKNFKVTPETPNANKIIEDRKAAESEKTRAPERKKTGEGGKAINKQTQSGKSDKTSSQPESKGNQTELPETKKETEAPGLLNDPTSPIYFVLIIAVLAIVFMKMRQTPEGKGRLNEVIFG